MFPVKFSLIIFHVHSRTYQLWSLNPVQQRSHRQLFGAAQKQFLYSYFVFSLLRRPSLSEVGIKNRKIFIGDTCFYLRQQISSSAESIDFILISVVHARVREVWNLTIVNSFSFVLLPFIDRLEATEEVFVRDLTRDQRTLFILKEKRKTNRGENNKIRTYRGGENPSHCCV